ncbi:MAG: hydrolase [Flavobacteriaceae bacterium]|nr:hydrolase [Flavobacteriaceae bacterium]
MKKHLIWYLISFLVLLLLFQLVNSNKVYQIQEKRIEKLNELRKTYKDSTASLFYENQDLRYFDLKHNDEALSYFEEFSDIDKPESFVMDKLLETNESKGNNPLVPYEGMEGVFKINKIKVLNHRWIIADFSDGTYWGELLIQYFVNQDRSVEFTVLDHLLYTRQ